MGKTKAEEHEALRKIREILKDFGPEDTYIGKAFEGCVEQADRNIDNDWMTSYKELYDKMTDELAKQFSQVDDALARLAEATDKLHESEEARVDLVKQLNQKDDTIARLTDANGQFSKEIDQKDAECLDLRGKVWEAEALIRDLRQTIIELKAKLYDMMTAGEEVKA